MDGDKLNEINKATRFGTEGGANPSEAGKKGMEARWSIRKELKYLSGQQLEGEDQDELKRSIKALRGKNPTVARVVAINTLLKAMTGDIRAAEYVTDNSEGKLPQTTINADWEKIKGMSDDDLRSFLLTGLAEIQANCSGDDGSQAPGHEDQGTGEAEATGSGQPEV